MLVNVLHVSIRSIEKSRRTRMKRSKNKTLWKITVQWRYSFIDLREHSFEFFFRSATITYSDFFAHIFSVSPNSWSIRGIREKLSIKMKHQNIECDENDTRAEHIPFVPNYLNFKRIFMRTVCLMCHNGRTLRTRRFIFKIQCSRIHEVGST